MAETHQQNAPQGSVLRRRSAARNPNDAGHATDLTTPAASAITSSLPIVFLFVLSTLAIVFFLLQFQSDNILRSVQDSIFAPQAGQIFPDAGTLSLQLRPDEHTTRPPGVIYHSWKVTRGMRHPDGVEKHVYLINDEFPGPTVEARSGDRLVVQVENGLQADEGLSIHWHGLYMRGANHMDGAVGFTQDPIPPGGNFTYEFDIDEHQAGTFWYHAHDQVQRGDGLFGGLVIHRPHGAQGLSDAQKYAYDGEMLLLVGDWYHRSAKDVLAWYMRAGSFGNEPVPDSLLVNGLGAYNCSKAVRARPVECVQLLGDAIPSITFDRTKRYRLRLVNTGTLAGFTLSIPSASLNTVEVDGGNAVTSTPASSVGILYPGQRTDLILSWPAGPHDQLSRMTIMLDGEDFKYPNPALTRTQSFPIILTNNSHPFISQPSENNDLAPHFSLSSLTSTTILPAPETANHTLLLYTNTLKLSRLSYVPHGFMNQTTWRPQTPPLIVQPRSAWDEHQFVPLVPGPSKAAADGGAFEDAPIVDIVLNNLDDGSHPFHSHGYSAWVLQTHAAGWGWGSWNPWSQQHDGVPVPPGGPLDLARPIKRDTFYVPRRGYVVLRLKADNPGLWMLHCHNLWHQASGMAMGIEVAYTE